MKKLSIVSTIFVLCIIASNVPSVTNIFFNETIVHSDSLMSVSINHAFGQTPLANSSSMQIRPYGQVPTGNYTIFKSNPVDAQSFIAHYTKDPPKFNNSQMMQFKQYLDTIDIPERPIPITNPNFERATPNTDVDTTHSFTSNVDLNEKNTNQIRFVSQENNLRPVSFGDMASSPQLNQNLNFNVQSSLRLEPSIASGNSIIFYSSNFFAARSTDGTNWDYFDPEQSPIDPNGHLIYLDSFAADSDVIFDPTNHIFIWYQQGITQNHVNVFQISYSSDAITWRYKVFSPTDIEPSWTSSWWDYPHLALTNNHLYITTNLHREDGITDSVILRQNLADMVNNNVFQFDSIISHNEFTITPVQGATDVMYFASHLTNEKMKIWQWRDDPASTPLSNGLQIGPWSPVSTGTIDCASMNNWCDKADNRILNGWKFGNRIGFFWNSASDAGSGFPKPYVNAAMFDVSTMTYVGRPYIKSSTDPIAYAYASPNGRGLGLIFFGGATPNAYVDVANPVQINNVNVSPGQQQISWDFTKLRSSTQAVASFGDYERVRSFNDDDCLWIASGYTSLQSNNPLIPILQPFITIFGSSTCPAIPEFGLVTPIVLVISTISIILLSFRTRSLY